MLDLRGPERTWRNVDLVRVSGGPAPWQWAILAAAGLSAGAWLVTAVVNGLRRQRPEALAERQPLARRRWRHLASILAALSAMLTLSTIGLVVAIPGLVDSGFLGWLEVPLALRLAFHLPLALAVVGATLIAVSIVGWVRGWWTGFARVQQAALVLATALVLGELGVWQLVGWGFS
jgi:hypothetical protein